MPQLIETFLAQMAVLFVSYSMITTGLLTVFIWDTLVFDKRDAMVLGPLAAARLDDRRREACRAGDVSRRDGPRRERHIGCAVRVRHRRASTGHILRHLAGHLSGTIGGAVFMFCTLVIVRGLLVLLVSAHAAATVGSLLQFVFLSAVLCFMMVPTATGQVIAADLLVRRALRAGFEDRVSARYPGLAQTRRSSCCRCRSPARSPSPSRATGSRCARRWRRPRVWRRPRACAGALAALITGRDRVARATSDFVLTTLARSRVQQAPIAIAASLGVAIISVALVTREGGFAELRTPRTVVLWIPIVLGYWIVVGLRASFVLPTELKAAWAFRVHSQLPSVVVLVGSARRDGRVRDRTGTARERARRASAARLASRRHSRARRHCSPSPSPRSLRRCWWTASRSRAHILPATRSSRRAGSFTCSACGRLRTCRCGWNCGC